VPWSFCVSDVSSRPVLPFQLAGEVRDGNELVSSEPACPQLARPKHVKQIKMKKAFLTMNLFITTSVYRNKTPRTKQQQGDKGIQGIRPGA
jgi:hypothetical protein